MSEQIIWTMEQDYCDECGVYLFADGINDDNSGLCSACFKNWLNDMEDEDVWYDEYGDGDYRAYGIEEARP